MSIIEKYEESELRTRLNEGALKAFCVILAPQIAVGYIGKTIAKNKQIRKEMNEGINERLDKEFADTFAI
ncbi:MAG: hypothetical protein FWC00_05005 [Firmicutes bacterium]|nr:hypothetical protein [Bacillota bacterium]